MQLKHFKPDGYPSLSPYLMVTGAQRVIDFLEQTLDAKELRRFEMPDGTIAHVELRIDDTVVMLAEGGGTWPPFPTWLHVYVPDVDATYQRALAAGGAAVQPPEQKPGDPDRRGGVKDPSGNTWWFSTQVG
ncbi:MAG TPA: VOC family protein [Gemmatimonadales bacterium]|nr:VOC family protein [Gemmatimonadales bacterium]